MFAQRRSGVFKKQTRMIRKISYTIIYTRIFKKIVLRFLEVLLNQNSVCTYSKIELLIVVKFFSFFKGSVIYFFFTVFKETFTLLNPKLPHSASHVVHPPTVWMYMLIPLIPFLSNNFPRVRVIFINFSVSLQTNIFVYIEMK